MAKKYLDNNGLLYFWQKITNTFVKKDGTKVLSTNDYTTTEKTKLSGIEEGANKTVVDTVLNSTSTNPVQNNVINSALNNKVDKITGKGLSTNDLTDDLLTKLNNTATKVEEIATVGGEPNIIETVKVNGTILTVTNKSVNVEVPTNNNQLTNGAGYITGIDNNDVTDALGFTPYNATNPNGYINAIEVGRILDDRNFQTSAQVNSIIDGKGYQTADQVDTAIADAIGDITGISYEVVTSLPSTGEAGVIYLLSNGGTNPNIYDEYIYTNNKFEKIGTTDVDLSDYVQNTDLEVITNSEIDTIVSNN